MSKATPKANAKHNQAMKAKKPNYQPEVILNPEYDVYRTPKESQDYDYYKALGDKQDLRRRLLREGFAEAELNGKTSDELKRMLEGMVEDEI